MDVYVIASMLLIPLVCAVGVAYDAFKCGNSKFILLGVVTLLMPFVVVPLYLIYRFKLFNMLNFGPMKFIKVIIESLEKSEKKNRQATVLLQDDNKKLQDDKKPSSQLGEGGSFFDKAVVMKLIFLIAFVFIARSVFVTKASLPTCEEPLVMQAVQGLYKESAVSILDLKKITENGYDGHNQVRSCWASLFVIPTRGSAEYEMLIQYDIKWAGDDREQWFVESFEL